MEKAAADSLAKSSIFCHLQLNVAAPFFDNKRRHPLPR
jgi:hypothetical protein